MQCDRSSGWPRTALEEVLEDTSPSADSVAVITAIGGVELDHPLASTTMSSTSKKMMCRL